MKARSSASLLTFGCRRCGEPTKVASRRAVAAARTLTGLRIWLPGRPGRLSTEPIKGPGYCAACTVENKEFQTEYYAASAERAGRKRAAAKEFCNRGVALDPDVSTIACLLAVTLAEKISLDGSFGPLHEEPTRLLDSLQADHDAVVELWQAGWLDIDPATSLAAFRFEDDATVTGVYAEYARWRFTNAIVDYAALFDGGTPCDLRFLEGEDEAEPLFGGTDSDGVEEIRVIACELQTPAALDYLDGLLTDRHGLVPVPDHRLDEADSHFAAAIAAGFSFGQVLYFAWRSAAAAATWAASKPGFRDKAGAAAVTHLGKVIARAKENPTTQVPAYNIPSGLQLPAVAHVALRIIARYESRRTAALQQLHHLLSGQRQPCDGFIEDYECDQPDPHFHPVDPFDFAQTVAETPDIDDPVDYALITGDGELMYLRGTRAQMHQVAGHGVGAERVWFEYAPRLRAFVCELRGTVGCDCVANPVANQMATLLGGAGTEVGPTVFFQVGHSSAEGSLTSLDNDHRAIIEAAQHAARTAHRSSAQQTVPG